MTFVRVRGLPARITAIIGLPAAFSLWTSSACAPGRLISARQCASPERIDSSPRTSARHQTDRLPRLPPQRRQYCDRGTLPSLEKVHFHFRPHPASNRFERGHTQCGVAIKNPGPELLIRRIGQRPDNAIERSVFADSGSSVSAFFSSTMLSLAVCRATSSACVLP